MGHSFQEDKETLKQLLFKEAFFKEKITLSCGRESDYYIDVRRVTLIPAGAYLCARIILEMISQDKIDAIGGPTIGADPIVGAITALSYQTPKPVNTFIIRKAPKPHGKQQQIEGPLLKPHSRVVLLDDVATTGKAFLQSIDVLKTIGIVPVYAVCLVDRQEGAAEALKEANCPLVSIFTSSDFLQCRKV